MKRAFAVFFLCMLAAALGVGAGEWLFRSPTSRAALAPLLGRGDLLALVGEVGIYAGDLTAQPGRDLAGLVMDENLRQRARAVPVAEEAIARELALLGAQFGDEQAFQEALAEAGWSIAALRNEVADHLRGRAWLEDRIAGALSSTADEQRQLLRRASCGVSAAVAVSGESSFAGRA